MGPPSQRYGATSKFHKKLLRFFSHLGLSIYALWSHRFQSAYSLFISSPAYSLFISSPAYSLFISSPLHSDRLSGIKDKPSRACLARRTVFESLVIDRHLKL